MKPLWVVVWVILALLVGCSSKENVIQPSPLPEFKKTVQLKKLWSRRVGTEFSKLYTVLQPAVSDDLIIASGMDGQVSAYNRLSGKRQWRNKLNAQVTGGLFADSDFVYLGVRSGELIALDVKEGGIVWRTQLSSELLAPPVSDFKYVIAQTVDGKLHALLREKGEKVWTYDTVLPSLTLRGTSSPLIQSGLVVAGFANGKLVGVDEETGTLVWERQVGIIEGRSDLERIVDIDGQFLLSGKTIYAASYHGKFLALDLYSGRPYWQRELSTYVPLSTDVDRVFVSEVNGTISALDMETGAILWSQEALKARQLSGGAVQGSFLVLGDLEGYLHWISTFDGHFAGRERVSRDPIRGAPVVVNGVLYILSSNGKLTAFEIR